MSNIFYCYLKCIKDLSTFSTISGSRNRTISKVSGSRNLFVHFYNFRIQKLQYFCSFWIPSELSLGQVKVGPTIHRAPRRGQAYIPPRSIGPPEIVEMVQFLDPETAKILQFLDPEIVNMDQKISGSTNCRNGAVSGSRNHRNTAVSGSRNCKNGQKKFWIQKLQKWCDFWIQKSQKRSTNPLW